MAVLVNWPSNHIFTSVMLTIAICFYSVEAWLRSKLKQKLFGRHHSDAHTMESMDNLRAIDNLRIMVLAFGRTALAGAACYLIFPESCQSFVSWVGQDFENFFTFPFRNPEFTISVMVAICAHVVENRSTDPRVQRFCWWIKHLSLPFAELFFLCPEHFRSFMAWSKQHVLVLIGWSCDNPVVSVLLVVAVCFLIYFRVRGFPQQAKLDSEHCESDLERPLYGPSPGSSYEVRPPDRGTSWDSRNPVSTNSAPRSTRAADPDRNLIVYHQSPRSARATEKKEEPHEEPPKQEKHPHLSAFRSRMHKLKEKVKPSSWTTSNPPSSSDPYIRVR